MGVPEPGPGEAGHPRQGTPARSQARQGSGQELLYTVFSWNMEQRSFAPFDGSPCEQRSLKQKKRYSYFNS